MAAFIKVFDRIFFVSQIVSIRGTKRPDGVGANVYFVYMVDHSSFTMTREQVISLLMNCTQLMLTTDDNVLDMSNDNTILNL